MTSLAIADRPATRRPQPFDITPRQRLLLGIAGGAVSAFALYAVIRALLGFAGPTDWLRNVALIVHLATAIPAIPLGAFVLLGRKGGPRHRLLGRTWLALMTATAISTIFIRDLNNGNFSFVHLFTLLAFIAVPKAILTARQGRIDDHKRHLVGFYAGALLIAGLFSFLPGRTMWHFAFS